MHRYEYKLVAKYVYINLYILSAVRLCQNAKLSNALRTAMFSCIPVVWREEEGVWGLVVGGGVSHSRLESSLKPNPPKAVSSPKFVSQYVT